MVDILIGYIKKRIISHKFGQPRQWIFPFFVNDFHPLRLKHSITNIDRHILYRWECRNRFCSPLCWKMQNQESQLKSLFVCSISGKPEGIRSSHSNRIHHYCKKYIENLILYQIMEWQKKQNSETKSLNTQTDRLENQTCFLDHYRMPSLILGLEGELFKNDLFLADKP